MDREITTNNFNFENVLTYSARRDDDEKKLNINAGAVNNKGGVYRILNNTSEQLDSVVDTVPLVYMSRSIMDG